MQILTHNRFVLYTLVLASCAVQAQEQPWRLDKTIGLPDWLSLSIQHRTRYETMDEQYRATVNGAPGSGGDQVLALRTLAHVRADLNYFTIGAEMEDARIELADTGTATSSNRLTTTIANPLELLQAYVEVPINNVLGEGSQSTIRGGRMTMDVGSRRLVARNRYRNTINSFTGLDWQWNKDGREVRAFYTLPVQRLVDGDIRDNKERFDVEDTDIRFWGLYYSQPTFSKADKAEAFLFGLNEDDTETQATRDRELYTFGMRFWRNPQAGEIDYQLETMYQLGDSKASTAANAATLNHWAHFHHGEVGYSFKMPWSPRLIAQFDYASGDDNPNDGENNRFDTLYGARRFDFGPTSTYASFARANLLSPALRINFKPLSSVQTMIATRGFWRASRADAWTTAGINGRSSFIGTQVEARVRWDVLPKNLRLEGGVAHLFAGDLMDEAGKVDTTYAYSQVIVQF